MLSQRWPLGTLRAPFRIVAPVVDLDTLGDPEPARIGAVIGRPGQPEPAANQAGAAAGVHQPSRAHLSLLPVAGFDADGVVQRIQRELLHRAAVEHIDAGTPATRRAEVLEPAAIELERRHRREHRGAQLHAPGKVAIVALREEVPQSELLQLARAQVRLELEHDLQVVRADLDRRLTDFERGFADRVLALLDDQHPHVGMFEVQLPRQREAGKAAAENDRVVAVVCGNRGRHVQAPGARGSLVVSRWLEPTTDDH